MNELKIDLSDKTIINLVGPSAVGKTTLINEIDKIYPNFSKVISYTTRQPRQGESLDTYRFIDAGSANIEMLKQQSVQYDQFPGTEIIYGTEPEDYKNEFNILDTLSTSVDTFRNLGFAACKQFIVVTSPSEWQKRIDTREFNEQQLLTRYEEAVKSLTWSMNENDRVKWIYNKSGYLQKAAELIVRLSADPEEFEKYKDHNPKEIGHDLLQYIKYLKKGAK